MEEKKETEKKETEKKNVVLEVQSMSFAMTKQFQAARPAKEEQKNGERRK